MQETGLALSKLLRDPNGEHRCDLVIALTHSRYGDYSNLILSSIDPVLGCPMSVARLHKPRGLPRLIDV